MRNTAQACEILRRRLEPAKHTFVHAEEKIEALSNRPVHSRPPRYLVLTKLSRNLSYRRASGSIASIMRALRSLLVQASELVNRQCHACTAQALRVRRLEPLRRARRRPLARRPRPRHHAHQRPPVRACVRITDRVFPSRFAGGQKGAAGAREPWPRRRVVGRL